ncbi:uncharacterized protein (DUF433 family) [Xanthobacter sp. SG618]|uniref:DUF433 domain-containing protein n=1 Tax=Xanthobacter sp. SG618 TaxID=2587121 RepID=UPI00145C596C|nr:uncharacterized protein (DUF433 family) [Xanthobacter sp. SG618]
MSTQTIADWHKVGGRKTLSERDHRAPLSYMQLIEVAVVAAARKGGVKLKDIAAARAYVSKQLKSQFPFAEHRFKMNGRQLLLDYQEFEPKAEKGRVVLVSEGGQIAWEEILGRLEQFEYDNGLALRWYLGGRSSPIVIDPRVSFGAPSVGGIPTWALKGRWIAGDTLSEIADDYALSKPMVEKALEFEGVDLRQSNTWVH